MMQKRVNLALMIICLLNVIFLATHTFSVRSVRAAAKKVYKTEIVPTGADKIQTMLDQRAAEGWQLVATSGHATPTSDVTVLIFEKQ